MWLLEKTARFTVTGRREKREEDMERLSATPSVLQLLSGNYRKILRETVRRTESLISHTNSDLLKLFISDSSYEKLIQQLADRPAVRKSRIQSQNRT